MPVNIVNICPIRILITLVGLDYCNKIPQTWLKQQAFISHGFEGWKLNTKVLEASLHGEGPLPGLQIATFPLCHHLAEGWVGWPSGPSHFL